MIGETISHYRITQQLGAGGMGVVYEAVDTNLDRTVALKFLPPESTRDPEAKARFIHEAKAASALDHPNVCTVFEIGETGDGHLFLAMARYHGETVAEKIARGPLPLTEAMDITQQVGAGLVAAHGQGIVHRDIKPANIFVTDTGLVKILDFGLAKLSDQTRLTQTGTSLGTAHYMSPEQVRAGATDRRTDLWGLGVVLYEMVTGRRPFPGDHQQAVAYAVMNQEPEPATALRTGVPLGLDQIILKALRKNPDQRYQHVDDMLVDLESVADVLGRAGGAGAESAVWRRTEVPAAGSGRWRWAGLGAALILATVLAVAFVLPRLQVGAGRRASADRAPGTIQSLAVLPFDNLMNDPNQDYFVEGIHEALITGLSQLGSLRVISRTSVMRYKDTTRPLTEIARELDVDGLIEGSVLRVDDEVRVTAQLIDGATDEHVWAGSYDRDLRNVLALLNEVAGAIAGEIHATLTPEQAARLAQARPVNLEAYDALLRGIQLFNTFRTGPVRESIAYFEQAIAIDEDFADAHAWLSGAYMVCAILGAPPQDVMPRAKVAAQRALDLDDGLAVAHTSMGYVHLYYDREWEAGAAAFRKALEIDPNNPMARHGYADYLLVVGQLDESVDQVVRGRQSNPLSPLSNAVVVGHLYIARRYEEAIAEGERLLAVDPTYLAVRSFIRRSYWQLGAREKSLAMLRETAWAQQPAVSAALARGYAAEGPEGAMAAVAAVLEAQADTTYVDPLDIAVYHGRAGQHDAAMDWLDKAEADLSPTLVHALLDPCFDPIRDTERFKALRRRMNLPG